MRLLVSFHTPGEEGTCMSQIIENGVQREEMELRVMGTRKVNPDIMYKIGLKYIVSPTSCSLHSAQTVMQINI
jgi:hypothetical protein